MVQSILFIDANRDDDARYVLVQQFTHLNFIPIVPILERKLSSPLVPALENCGQEEKIQQLQNTRHARANESTAKKNIRFDGK